MMYLQEMLKEYSIMLMVNIPLINGTLGQYSDCRLNMYSIKAKES